MRTWKSLVVSSALCLIVNLAHAAPPTFETYVKGVAASTGHAEKEVRNDAIETLRKEGKYSDEDLQRIGYNADDLDAKTQTDIVDLLKTSTLFHAKIGLTSVRNDSIAQ